MSEFKCRENCSECCGPVGFSEELIRKFEHLKQVKPKKILKGPDGLVWALTDDLKCVFLDRKKDKCVIYDFRPKICRDYGTGVNEGLLCVYVKPNGNLRSLAMEKRMRRVLNKNLKLLEEE